MRFQALFQFFKEMNRSQINKKNENFALKSGQTRIVEFPKYPPLFEELEKDHKSQMTACDE